MKKQSIINFSRLLIPVICFLGILAWVITALVSAGDTISEKELESVRISIENGITMCYAVEGIYPEDIDYLEENYGVFIDDSRFIVNYEYFADNVRPNVKVIERGESY